MLKKEKNFIIFEKEENKVYKLDINKGIWYGLKGQELVNVPPLFKSEVINYNGDNALIKCIKETVNWNYRSCKEATMGYTANMTMLDLLISFLSTINKNLYSTYVNNCDIEILRQEDCLKKYGKELKEKLSQFEDNNIRIRTIVNLIDEIKRDKMSTLYKLNEEDKTLFGYNDEWFRRFIQDVNYQNKYYPKTSLWILKNSTNINKAIYWFFREYKYCPECRDNVSEFIYTLDRLIKYLEPFNKTLDDIDKHHFVAQYIQYHRDYEANRDKFENEKLAQIDYSKWFFEDDNYITVFPKSKQDFVVEGQKQQNCVGGYSSYVIEGHRIVTFIRRKDNIDKPLVTCDICNINNGCVPYINQFLKAHNSYVRQTDEVYEFYRKFREHIESLTN
jgi:hypothetical protein